MNIIASPLKLENQSKKIEQDGQLGSFQEEVQVIVQYNLYLTKQQGIFEYVPSKTINDQFEKLCQSIFAEKTVPEIIQYQTRLLEGFYNEDGEKQRGFLEMVQQQVSIFSSIFSKEQGINSMKKQVNDTKDQMKQIQTLYLTLHVMELERVKFIMKEYLRIRLAKIERYAFYLHNNDMDILLSIPERKYLKRYSITNQVYKQFNFDETSYPTSLKPFRVLDCSREPKTPKANRQEKGIKRKLVHLYIYNIYKEISTPNSLQYVIIRIRTDKLINYERAQLKQGDILMVPYSDIKQLHQREFIDFL